MLPFSFLLLFWLALALPGFALLWQLDREALRGGFLFGLGRAYLASFMLLTPSCVLGYTLELPLATLSGSYVLSVLLACAALIWDRSWLHALRRPSALAAIGGIWLCCDMWLGLRAGTHVEGDAGYHIARIRMLLDSGLCNWDPLVAQPRLDTIYHTNLYHALIASSAQLTGQDAGAAWLGTWPFAKLLTAAGAYQLARVAIGERWHGWLAAITTSVFLSSYAVLPFPNTLAPAAILPMALAAGVSALCTPRSLRPACWIAVGSVTLAEMHALNALFLGLVLVPCLSLLWLVYWARRRRGKRYLAAAILACAASLPWLIVPALPRLSAFWSHAQLLESRARAQPSAAPQTSDPPKASAAKDTDKEQAEPGKGYKSERFRKLPNGLSMYEPAQLFGQHDRNLLGLLLLAATLTLAPHAELWAMSALIAMTCLWLLVPALCSTLLAITGPPWAAARLTQIVGLAFTTLVPAAPCSLLDRMPLRSVWRQSAWLAAGALAAWVGFGQGVNYAGWTRAQLVANARDFKAEQSKLAIEARVRLLSNNIPRGETVMAHPRWDYGLPMHCRCFALALGPGRGWHGMPYMPERRNAVDEFFSDKTTGARRLDLMQQFATQHVYTSLRLARMIMKSLPEHARILASTNQGTVLFIDL
jgi:hypothetical protein